MTTLQSVLIVEDDGLIRMNLVDILADFGVPDILEATNVEQALQVLDSQPCVQAMLTDIDLPGTMDGLRLAHLAADRWPECRIVVISGRLAQHVDVLPQGTLFVAKPFCEIDLRNILDDLLHQSR